MQNKFDAPELRLIGQAGEVVMGTSCCGGDAPLQGAPDFEFEDDSL